MSEVKIAVPGEKRITVVVSAPGVDGSCPVGLHYEGFAGPNETATRMEIVGWLLMVAENLVQAECRESGTLRGRPLAESLHFPGRRRRSRNER